MPDDPSTRPGKLHPAFLLLIAVVATVGFLLRPRVAYELWQEQTLERESGGDERRGDRVEVVDVDGDGLPDLLFAGTSRALFRNLGRRRFERAREVPPPEIPPAESPRAAPPRDPAGEFDTQGLRLCVERAREGRGFRDVEVLDVDNDGDLDVWVPSPGRGRMHLSDGRGNFKKVERRFGEVFSRARDVLWSAAADLDGDGRLDLVLDLADGPPVVLWNELEPRHWLRLRLEPASGGPPTAPVGARVEVQVGGRVQVRWLTGAGGPPGAAATHFGLGGEEEVDRLRIVWPSGSVDRHEAVEADREYTAYEGGRLSVSMP